MQRKLKLTEMLRLKRKSLLRIRNKMLTRAGSENKSKNEDGFFPIMRRSENAMITCAANLMSARTTSANNRKSKDIASKKLCKQPGYFGRQFRVLVRL